MKIVAISDMHGHLPTYIPAGDVLVIAGDSPPTYNHDVYYQSNWFNNDFYEWGMNLKQIDKIIWIAGNHCFICETNKYLLRPELTKQNDKKFVYLENSHYTFEGKKFFGLPGTPPFNNWAFNLSDRDRQMSLDLIAEDTSVLISHGPPYGYGDRTFDGLDVGCKLLLKKIENLPNLKVVLAGHIHEGRGQYKIGKTKLFNCTIVDEHYKHIYPPFEIII